MTENPNLSANRARRSSVFLFQTGAGLFVLIAGLIVIAGWHTGSRTLIQILPAFVPMQYNTAVGFVLCGLALVFSARDYARCAMGIGIMIFMLGALTLSQYVLGLNLGLDELLMDHYVRVKTSHPGRMAPNTALCFMLSGAALVVARLGLRHSHLTSSLFGAVVTALGSVALMGYIADVSTAYNWSGLTAMAVHTAVLFIVFGSAKVLHMWNEIGTGRNDLAYRLPVLAMIAGLTVTACLWQAHAARENSGREVIDEIVLIFGALFTLLLAWTLHLFQKTRLEGHQKTLANRNLTGEVEERRSIEQRLRETTAFQQAILDGANYMIISTDVGGIIQTFNRTAEKLLGYTADEVIGKFSPEIIHIEDEVSDYTQELNEEGFDLEPGFETFVARAREDYVDEREWTYVRKDGSTFPVMLSVTALRGEDGAITGYLGVGRDISDLKEVREKFIQSEEKFKAFMDNTPAAAFIKDSRGRYLFVNRTLEEKFKVRAEELIGKKNSEVLPTATGRRLARQEKKLRQTGGILKTVEQIPIPDGPDENWLFIRFPVPNPNGPDHLGGVGIDITENKRLEKELMAATDAALQSARMKSEFLANMSHEIRTPMNGVLGMIEILLNTRLDESQAEYARTIRESAESLLTIINDILDFSKIEAGKIVFETIDFDLRTTVENVTGIFSEEVARKGIELDARLGADVPTELRGDPGRLKQILINLVGNAVKFTSEGSIGIRVELVSETDKEVFLRFDVADTGIGIRSETQEFLFDAFTQADGSMTRKHGGTGLGLAISKQLVELLDGKISLASEHGRGSTFSFTARFDKQVVEEAEEIEPIRDLKNLRALIIDDNATNRDIIAHQIAGWGVISDGTGKTDVALMMLDKAAAEGRPFDLVFLDLMMPGIDGFAFARTLRQNERFDDVKIILMPSFGQRGHAQNALRAGIDAYLVKPIRQSDLRDCIATVMGRPKSDPGQKQKKRKPPAKLITRHTLSELRQAEGGRLLVAEDNLVNQKVVMSQIKQLGYRADVVADGREVLEALGRKKYSLILMDCQMPEMDGYEATAEIRRTESNGTRIPIIAITASAMVGEKEKCLEAGMDDYLSKPFKQDDLKRALEKWLGAPAAPAAEEEIDPAGRFGFLPEITERLKELRTEVGEDMVEMIASLFVEDSLLRLKKMRQMHGSGNREEIGRELHSLNGSALNIGANHISRLCTEFQGRLAEFDDAEIEKRMAELEAAFFTTFEALELLNLNTAAQPLVNT